jgi:hypothetical protein
MLHIELFGNFIGNVRVFKFHDKIPPNESNRITSFCSL